MLAGCMMLVGGVPKARQTVPKFRIWDHGTGPGFGTAVPSVQTGYRIWDRGTGTVHGIPFGKPSVSYPNPRETCVYGVQALLGHPLP